jgi:hypothetical protein
MAPNPKATLAGNNTPATQPRVLASIHFSQRSQSKDGRLWGPSISDSDTVSHNVAQAMEE